MGYLRRSWKETHARDLASKVKRKHQEGTLSGIHIERDVSKSTYRPQHLFQKWTTAATAHTDSLGDGRPKVQASAN